MQLSVNERISGLYKSKIRKIMTETERARFGTTVNCMDGRAVEATIDWMKDTFHLDHIDAITEPGMVALISKMDSTARAWLRRKLEISLMHHGSHIVTVGGHADCAGNPVHEAQHMEDVAKSVLIIKEIISEIAPGVTIDVVGVFVSPNKSSVWRVERI